MKYDEAIKTLKTGDEVTVTIRGTMGNIYSVGVEVDGGGKWPSWYDQSNTGDGVEFTKHEPTPRELFLRLKVGAWFTSSFQLKSVKYIKTGDTTFMSTLGNRFNWQSEESFSFTPTEVEPG